MGMRVCRAAAISALEPTVHSWFWLTYTKGASGRDDAGFWLVFPLAMTSSDDKWLSWRFEEVGCSQMRLWWGEGFEIPGSMQ